MFNIYLEKMTAFNKFLLSVTGFCFFKGRGV